MEERIRKLEWETLTPTYGRLIVEPFRRGFATTIGNSLRRTLLSSIKGAAVTAIKIDNLPHEFTTIKGMVEDPIDFILNIRNIVFKYDKDEKRTLLLEAKKGKVLAGMIKTPPDVTIINPDLYLATISDEEVINIEMELESGIGYVPADEKERKKRIGIIPIDAYFSPIKRVNFSTEEIRVGRITDYERLILEITTNGSISPQEAVSKAASIVSNYITIFINPEPFLIEEEKPEVIDKEKEKLKTILNTRIDEFEISVRATNCLKAAGIIRVGDIVKMTEQELLGLKNFGRKSLIEIKEKLAEYNLTLGMEETEELLEPLSEEEIREYQEEVIEEMEEDETIEAQEIEEDEAPEEAS